jgi:hypothetical protein
MNAFFAELARKLADRWLTLLVPPGLLFLGACAAGGTLGQRGWNDVRPLLAATRRTAHTLDEQGAVAAALALLAILLLSAAAGLTSYAVAAGVQRLWLGQWPPPDRVPARWLVDRRHRRWQRLHDEYAALVGSPGDAPLRAAAIATARNRIAPARPRRATWMGDRVAAVETRVHGQYALDLVAAWSRLWLVASDTTRTELRQAHERFTASTGVAAWGTLYLLLGARWWPAAAIGATLIVIGWRTGRVAADGLADLLEATVDVHGRDLAAALGVPAEDGPLTPESGEEITRRLRKGA